MAGVGEDEDVGAGVAGADGEGLVHFAGVESSPVDEFFSAWSDATVLVSMILCWKHERELKLVEATALCSSR